MSHGKFISRVLSIKDPEAMRAFFDTEVAYMRDKHPEIPDPAEILASNIGWCFGEGVPLATRKKWADATGAVHPGFGPEYAEREFTFEECLNAGKKLAETRQSFKPIPSAWDLVLRERFGD